MGKNPDPRPQTNGEMVDEIIELKQRLDVIQTGSKTMDSSLNNEEIDELVGEAREALNKVQHSL